MAWTLLTWNIRGSARPDLGDLVSVIRGYEPDVVLLQEAWRSQADRIGEQAGLAHRFWSFKHKPYGPFVPGRAEGMAILARRPLTGASVHVLTPGASAWTHRRRIVQYAGLASLGVTVVNVHLASHGDAAARVAQAGRVLQHLEHLEAVTGRCVVAGDFNAVDEPDLFASFAAVGVHDGWTAAGSGFTNPAGAVRQRLDRVLVGADLVAESVEVPADDPAWGRRSDHLPVVARIG